MSCVKLLFECIFQRNEHFQLLLSLPPANVVCEGYIFTDVCDSVNGGGVCGCSGGHLWLSQGGHAWLLGGACMVARGGVRGCYGGHVWLLRGGGMHGCYGGVCVVFAGGCVVFARGHAWFFAKGACMVFPRGACVVFPGGACVVFPGGACIGYDEIRSMSGRYASYWNAFLLIEYFRGIFPIHEYFCNDILKFLSVSPYFNASRESDYLAKIPIRI